MNLYLLSQNDNTGYDTYDSIVVAAPSEEVARNIRPHAKLYPDDFSCWDQWASSPDTVMCRLIGKAAKGIEQGIILESYNAG